MNTINNSITEVKDQITQLNNVINKIVNSLGYYAESLCKEDLHRLITDDLRQLIHEEAESLKGIYTSDLLNWLRDTVDSKVYLRRAIDELGADANTDLDEAIRTAQYIYYYESLDTDYETLDRLKSLVIELEKLEQIAELERELHREKLEK